MCRRRAASLRALLGIPARRRPLDMARLRTLGPRLPAMRRATTRPWSVTRFAGASATGAYPATPSDRSNPGILWSAVGAAALALAVGATLGRAPLNLYDVSFSLDWGSDLINGLLPDVRVSGASTPHPLAIASGALAALFGSSALDVTRALLLVSAGVAGVALYRIGSIASSRAVGVAAVAALFLSEPFL